MNVPVSNHARMRYLERVRKFSKEKIKACQGGNDKEKLGTLKEYGVIDIEKIDREMFGRDPERVKKNIIKLGTCRYPLRSHTLKVCNGVVVTVTTKEDHDPSLK